MLGGSREVVDQGEGGSEDLETRIKAFLYCVSGLFMRDCAMNCTGIGHLFGLTLYIGLVHSLKKFYYYLLRIVLVYSV